MPRSLAALSGNAQGALWILASVAGATAMTLAIRYLADDIHTTMLAFLRASLSLVMVLPFFWRARNGGPKIVISSWKLHILRGCLLSVALNAGFYAIWQLPLAVAAILFFLAPVFATVLAGPLVGEKVGPRRWAAIAVGFLGALIILRPGVDEIDPAMLVAVISSMAFASALLVGRMISDRDGTGGLFVSSSVIVAIATLPPALFFWEMPSALWQWGAVAVLVVSSSLRTYADIRAYAVGDAGFLAPFTYLRLVTVGIAGYVLFNETLDRPTLLGGSIIIAATLYIALRERRKKLPARPAQTP